LMQAIDRLRADAQLRADLVRNALRAAASFHAPRVAATLRNTIDMTRHAPTVLPGGLPRGAEHHAARRWSGYRS
jgi:formate-dependent nitrite reductase cytochrome c552 subunit